MSKKKKMNLFEPIEYDANLFGMLIHVVDYMTPVKKVFEQVDQLVKESKKNSKKQKPH